MRGFDIIAAAGKGYEYVWTNRFALLNLALVPLLAKVIALAIILGFSLEENFLRQGLILLPSFFLDGWLVCMLLKHKFCGSDKGSLPPGFKKGDSDVLAGTLLYVIFQMLLFVVAWFYMQMSEQAATLEEPPEPSLTSVFISALILFGTIWGFRAIWLYILPTLGIRFREYFHTLGGLSASFFMIGAWLICQIPVAVALILVHEFFAGITGHTSDDPVILYQGVMVVIQAVADLSITMIVSVAMAHGIYEMVYGKPDKPKGRVD